MVWCRYATGFKQTAECWLRGVISQAVILLITRSHCFLSNFNPSVCHITQHQLLAEVVESSGKSRKGVLNQLFSAVLWKYLRKYRKILTADSSDSSKPAWREKKYYLTLKRRKAFLQYKCAKAWRIHNLIPAGITSKFKVFQQITKFLWA